MRAELASQRPLNVSIRSLINRPRKDSPPPPPPLSSHVRRRRAQARRRAALAAGFERVPCEKFLLHFNSLIFPTSRQYVYVNAAFNCAFKVNCPGGSHSRGRRCSSGQRMLFIAISRAVAFLRNSLHYTTFGPGHNTFYLTLQPVNTDVAFLSICT